MTLRLSNLFWAYHKHSEKSEAFFEGNAPVTYLVHVARVNLIAVERGYLTSLGIILLDILPAGSREMEIEGGEAGLEKDVSRFETLSSEFVPSETLRLRGTSSSS